MLFMTTTVALTAPGTLQTPQLFASGVISGPMDNGSPTFSPDGKTLFFTRSGDSQTPTIMESTLTPHGWSLPIPAPFSGEWNDQHPAFSPDGRFLVFVSTRPFEGAEGRVANLWRVQREGSGWSKPEHLPATVNIGPAIFAPSVAADGSIYFLKIDKENGKRIFQLYRSRFSNGAYALAEKLSFSSPATADVDPEVAPDQSFLVFASSGRRKGDTNEHLYIVRRSGKGWGSVSPLHYAGERASSNDNEPRIGRDGRTLYFASDRNGGNEVWWTRDLRLVTESSSRAGS
jgi:Tol biopolymer transport system component